MNLELRDNLDTLYHGVSEFIEYTEYQNTKGKYSDIESEYELLEDDSGISNTDLDNLIVTLEHVLQLVNKLK